MARPKGKQQQELPNMPPKSELTKLAERYGEERLAWDAAYKAMGEIGAEILKQLKDEELDSIAFEVDGIKFVIFRDIQQERIRCSKRKDMQAALADKDE